jgi:methylated-DNA-[protein]-cysteine S-methyltransferase
MTIAEAPVLGRTIGRRKILMPGVLRLTMATAPHVADVSTQIGTFRVLYNGRTVLGVDLAERGAPQLTIPEGAVRDRGRWPAGSPPAQLREYFDGKRRRFDIDLAEDLGTPFYRSVWTALRDVPVGATTTYGALARKVGHPRSARAVGGAMHRNPVPIIVPCHRVVGDDLSLTGYGMGLWRKRWLLQHEGAWPLRTGSHEGPRGSGQRTLLVREE